MTNLTDNACRFLESLQRFDLGMLLRPCNVGMAQNEVDNGFFTETINVAIIEAPTPIDKALRDMPAHDRKRVAEAIGSLYPNNATPNDILVKSVSAHASGNAALLAELLIHREMMIDVATGGARIQEVDDYYKARETRIRQTVPENTTYANPHTDLWDWYRHWSAHLPQYKDRRAYIRQLFGGTIEAVSQRAFPITEPREPTGWERVDRTLKKARAHLENAFAEEDCQAIGLLCREIIISLAQAVYNPDIHTTLDGIQPSDTDANRMLEAYIGYTFPGASNKELRAHARAALALALNLQHRRTATRQLAALCVEATSSTAAVISIIARQS